MKKDLTGKTFRRLLVLGVSEVSRNGHYRYNVRCECGTIKTVLGTPAKILDPFMGTGTTKLAAQNLNVEADGIDLKEWT